MCLCGEFYLAENPASADPLWVKTLTERMGLDKPIWEQYIIWLRELLRGNLGWSFVTRESVTNMLIDRLTNTAVLMSLALLVSILISIPLGVITAVKQYSILDNQLMLFTLFGASMPGFWLGLMLIFIFGVQLDWFPVTGTHTLGLVYTSWLHEFFDRLSYLVLPVMTLSFSRLAMLTRLTRSAMLEVLNQDYIVSARAKGLKELVVIYKHALRNALLPIITIIGLSVGVLFAGSGSVETIFAWPGLGKLIVDNVIKRDYPAIMGATMLIAITVMLSNLLTDLVYAYLDPRIKYG